jgi:hypothetical protein
MRLATSVTSSAECWSEEKAIQMIGLASASTLAITGSSISVGSLLRTRETRSRTSDAAESGSRSSLKRTEIWLFSCREIEVMTSTPSIPASESSSGLLICDSMISAEAPR